MAPRHKRHRSKAVVTFSSPPTPPTEFTEVNCWECTKVLTSEKSLWSDGEINSLLHVILSSIDMLKPQKLLWAVQRVGWKCWLRHLGRSGSAGQNEGVHYTLLSHNHLPNTAAYMCLALTTEAEVLTQKAHYLCYTRLMSSSNVKTKMAQLAGSKSGQWCVSTPASFAVSIDPWELIFKKTLLHVTLLSLNKSSNYSVKARLLVNNGEIKQF